MRAVGPLARTHRNIREAFAVLFELTHLMKPHTMLFRSGDERVVHVEDFRKRERLWRCSHLAIECTTVHQQSPCLAACQSLPAHLNGHARAD